MSSLGLLRLSPFVIPQSERLIVAVASAPHIGFLLNGFSPQTKFVTLKLTGLVTPIIVKSPSTWTTRSPSNVSLSDLNVSVGNFSTLKNRSPLTIASSLASKVRIDVASIVMSMLPFFASRSSITLPDTLPKLPRCGDMLICRASHCGCE